MLATSLAGTYAAKNSKTSWPIKRRGGQPNTLLPTCDWNGKCHTSP